MAMVSKTIDVFPKNQYTFIQMNGGSIDSSGYCRALRIGYKPFVQIVKENLKGYTHFSDNSMGLDYMKSLLLNKKPIIYNYNLDGTQSHIVVIDSFLHNDFDTSNNICLLKIKDPWPVNQGNEYYMTYERYYAQNQGYSDAQPRKYTISFDDDCNSTGGDGITNTDKNYLRKVLYDRTSSGVINSLFNGIGKFPRKFNKEFYQTSGLDSSDMSSYKIYKEFYIINVSLATFTSDPSFSINTLLNYESNFIEKLSVISKTDSIKTVISTSNKKPHSDSTYDFYNNWIIYHIEKGRYFEDILFLANQGGFETQVLQDNGLILRCADTYFLVTKKGLEYFVAPIYNETFGKLLNDNTIDNYHYLQSFKGFLGFNKFADVLKNYLNN